MSDLISELPDEFSTELFGFLLDQHRKPIAKAQFKVLVEGESKTKNIQTDELGRFSLKNLNPYLNYEVETQPEDPSFKGITRIYITDQQKQIIKVADISFGKFSFKILHSDRMQLSELAESKEDVFSSRVDDYARSIKKDTLNAKSFSLPHIYYHLGEVQYDSTSRDILQQALDSLTANPQFKLKIHSHTDAISPDYYNMDLSIRRALYIRTFFITQGISIKRISYKGFEIGRAHV